MGICFESEIFANSTSIMVEKGVPKDSDLSAKVEIGIGRGSKMRKLLKISVQKILGDFLDWREFGPTRCFNVSKTKWENSSLSPWENGHFFTFNPVFQMCIQKNLPCPPICELLF